MNYLKCFNQLINANTNDVNADYVADGIAELENLANTQDALVAV